MIAALKPYTAYKESGLPWLGQVPEHWDSERAKWLFIKMNRPVRDEDEVVTCFRDGVVTLRKNRRLTGFTEATAFSGYQGIRKGDLVIHGMDAFAGAIGVSDSDGKGTPVYNVCQPRPGVNAKYYAGLVRQMSQSQWILALAKGIRERSTDFRFEMFGNQVVPLPPLDEQAAIVKYLDWANGRLELAIRAKRKVITLLNEQKQAIIHRAVTQGLNPSAPLKPSGIQWLGDIPGHWVVRRIKSVVSNVADQTTVMEDQDSYIALEDVESWTGRVTPHRRLNEKLFTGQVKKYKTNDVLFGKLRPYLAKAITASGTGVCSGEFLVLRADHSIVHPLYIEQLLRTKSTIDVITSSTFGAKMPRADWQFIGGLSVALPPVSEQVQITESIQAATRPLVETITRYEREVDLLREYRTRLVADVVTGKFDVREAAARLPEEVPLDTVEDAADLDEDLDIADGEATV